MSVRCLNLWCDFDGFGERVIFGWLDCGKCLIFVGEMGLGWYFVLSNLYGFFEDFNQVRLKPYFIRAERCFEGIFDDFSCGGNGEKHWFFKVLSNSVSNSKWGSRHENIRCAVPDNRTLVLKCKPTGDICRTNVLKYTIIVQYYSIFLTVK